ncbi:globin [Paracraurococcus lichenis]|uniref:Globin n=1 Tax=Paracraurococcus lichenis TaxID=3064888 RepID=A0ABT9DX27_9PROT|nr:globin [Paracraurococcus sp. LOR1-02]MDO9708345.1 globin [Paracraurococcus sp. LOR1-02]
MDGDAVAESLALYAARHGDPAPAVYARLFARHPEAEALFLLDTGGHVRGQMLAVALEALLDGGERLAGLIGIERLNHANIGVPEALFDGFYALLMQTVRESLGPDWTPAMESGWRARLDALGLPA